MVGLFLRMISFCITKLHLLHVSKTDRLLLYPTICRYPQLTCRAAKPFQAFPSIPTLHTSYSLCVDGPVQLHRSLSFQSSKSQYQHLTQATTRLYADRDQKSLRGLCSYRQQTDSP